MPAVPDLPRPRPLSLSTRVLMGPGPSDVHPRVLAAHGRCRSLGHLDPEFVALMDETQDLLRYVFQTENRLTLAVSGTGSAGMETVVVNLIEPGDKMLVCINGVFGARMKDVAERGRGPGHRDRAALWRGVRPGRGQGGDPSRPAQGRRDRPCRDIHGRLAAGRGDRQDRSRRRAPDRDRHRDLAGRVPVEIDAWEIDAVYSGTQKCLSCPPGLAPVSFGPRAVEALNRRKTKVQSWYLDLTMIQRYWGSDRFYHHTAPISMNYALREALALVVEEGLEARFARHALNGRALNAGLAAMGLSLATAPRHQLPQLTCVRIPDGIDDLTVRRRLLKDWGIEIGGGLGPFKGQAWRIGLMGYGSRQSNVTLLLAALETCLRDLGFALKAGEAIQAAAAVYAEANQP